jgi:hypothetical protein
MANPSRGKTWPEDGPRSVRAMAGDKSSPAWCNRALQSSIFELETTWVKQWSRRTQSCHFRERRKTDMALAMDGGGKRSSESINRALEATVSELIARGGRGDHGKAHHGETKGGKGAGAADHDGRRTSSSVGATP